MTVLVKSLRSIKLPLNEETRSRFRLFLIGLAVISLGVLFGYLNSLSQDTAELTISIVVVLIMLFVIAHKPLNGLVVLLILMPFVEQYVEIPMGAGIPDLSFSRFIVAFLFVFMLAHAAIGKFQFAVPFSWAEICIVGTIFAIVSVAPLDSDPNKSIQVAFTRRFTPLIMYFLARSLIKDKSDLYKLLSAVTIFGLAISIYAIYEHSTGHILFVGKETDVNQLRTEYTGGLYLIRGLLSRAGNFARVLVTTIPVTFYLFFESKQVRWKALLIIALLLQFYAMFITYNRTCWYALMVALFVLQFFYPQFRRLYLALILVAAIALWLTWSQVTASDVVEGRINHRTEDFNGRSERWNAAINMWKDKPIRGWGFDAYPQFSGRYRTDGFNKNIDGMENDYLFLLVGSGLMGFVPYALFLLIPLFDSIRLFFRARSPTWPGFIKPETVAIYWGVLISFLMSSYTQTQSEAIVMMLPFALAGAIVGTHQVLLDGSKVKHNAQARFSSFPSVAAK